MTPDEGVALRASPFRPAHDVRVFVDGAPIDVRGMQTGPGSMRFPAGPADGIATGLRVAAVFRPRTPAACTFLVAGRIAGRIAGRTPRDVCIEIRCTRAVTDAPALDFARFLLDTFDVIPAPIVDLPDNAPNGLRREFRFPGDDLVQAPCGGAQPLPIAAFRPASPLDPRTVPAQARVSTPDAPAAVDAILEVVGHGCSGRIVRLGPDGMLVQTNCVPHDRSLPVAVTFDIATDEGPSTVVCDCRVIDIDDGRTTGLAGVHLHVVRVDEGPFEGLFERYVRRLQRLAATGT